MNFIRKTVCRKLGMLLLVAVILIVVLVLGLTNWTDKDRVSNNFAEQLFKYPPPPKTKVIENEQANGKYLVGGSGGYWGVIASVRLSTRLSKEEIIMYYKKAGLFKYPKSDKRGVEPEIYFQGDFQKVKSPEDYYYKDKDGTRKSLSNYYDESGNKVSGRILRENHSYEMEYVVQITSDFDYFLNID
ncbi:hypothetical protein [Priestia aryabhattai]|uniref:hypothetical protein n=1 Tax=Priestia aryabhattai TaxID=412384 RepID=UPI0024529DA3|nr:hypothetical protein [Priestia aryabhattai]MDH3111257.1 hypothetical protein [Priestia aryabhattai]MDH3129986.1 hypothetical protein [Priestia aryabhattai]